MTPTAEKVHHPLFARLYKRTASDKEDKYRRELLAGLKGQVVEVEVVEGVASELPAAEESFDAGIASLVLCSVPDQQRALAELRRVIRPGGELLGSKTRST